MEPTGMCLLKRLRPGVCPCEHNAFVLSTQNDPQVRRYISMQEGRGCYSCGLWTDRCRSHFQVVDVVEDNHKRRLLKCGGVSADTAEMFVIPTQVRCELSFSLVDLAIFFFFMNLARSFTFFSCGRSRIHKSMACLLR